MNVGMFGLHKWFPNRDRDQERSQVLLHFSCQSSWRSVSSNLLCCFLTGSLIAATQCTLGSECWSDLNAWSFLSHFLLWSSPPSSSSTFGEVILRSPFCFVLHFTTLTQVRHAHHTQLTSWNFSSHIIKKISMFHNYTVWGCNKYLNPNVTELYYPTLNLPLGP